MTLSRTFSTLLVTLVCTANAEIIDSRVYRVVNGPAIAVYRGGPSLCFVNLAGVRAPHKGDSLRDKFEDFGDRAQESLSELVLNRQVTVNIVTANSRRLAGTVHLAGKDVGLVQVERGMARIDRNHLGELSPDERILYESAESVAKATQRGLWRTATKGPGSI